MKKIRIMKKSVMFAMAIVFIASILGAKVKGKNTRPKNDITLANIEALTNTEETNRYVCYGQGNVTCPYTEEKVMGYYQRLNLE